MQEIVSRQGWIALNDMAFTITGSGRRTAEAFEGGAGVAPLLYIEYNPPADRVPNARNDSFATDVNVPVTTGNVSANDLLGDMLTRIVAFDATGTQGGRVANNGNGTFTFSPATGFTGTDTFTYTIADQDGDTSTGVVSWTSPPRMWCDSPRSATGRTARERKPSRT